MGGSMVLPTICKAHRVAGPSRKKGLKKDDAHDISS